MLSSRDVASMLDGPSKNMRRESAPCASAISVRVASVNVNTLSPCDDTIVGPTLSVTGMNLGFAIPDLTTWPHSSLASRRVE